ncbi:MAG: hypothetical protein GY822_05735 [Deltaproteobacteria bacterium]|nr:hypothetical protein [Deltaproteobacteria bacterium]
MNALLAVSILSGALTASFAQAAPLVDVGVQQTQQVQMLEQAPQDMAGTLSLMNLRMASDADLQGLHDVNSPSPSGDSIVAGTNTENSTDAAKTIIPPSGAPPSTSVDVEPLLNLDLDFEKAGDALLPSAMSAADPLVLLDGINDGKVRLDIPLKAGSYDAVGVVKVAPGTVLHIDVEVQDGKLVPSSSDGGTRATFSNALDAKAWVEADGLYLDATGGGEGRLMVDLSGFF